jgi:hypothetical protein
MNALGTVFRFRSTARRARGLRSVVIRHGRKIKVKATSVGITLDERTQGVLAASLATGTRRYCMLFGGEVRRDEPGKFAARDAPAPAAVSRAAGGDDDHHHDDDRGSGSPTTSTAQGAGPSTTSTTTRSTTSSTAPRSTSTTARVTTSSSTSSTRAASTTTNASLHVLDRASDDVLDPARDDVVDEASHHVVDGTADHDQHPRPPPARPRSRRRITDNGMD